MAADRSHYSPSVDRRRAQARSAVLAALRRYGPLRVRLCRPGDGVATLLSYQHGDTRVAISVLRALERRGQVRRVREPRHTRWEAA